MSDGQIDSLADKTLVASSTTQLEEMDMQSIEARRSEIDRAAQRLRPKIARESVRLRKLGGSLALQWSKQVSYPTFLHCVQVDWQPKETMDAVEQETGPDFEHSLLDAHKELYDLGWLTAIPPSGSAD